jgi:hypothetical protein
VQYDAQAHLASLRVHSSPQPKEGKVSHPLLGQGLYLQMGGSMFPGMGIRGHDMEDL